MIAALATISPLRDYSHDFLTICIPVIHLHVIIPESIGTRKIESGESPCNARGFCAADSRPRA